MTLNTTMQDRIREYLNAVAEQIRNRPAAARRELLRDLETHLHEAVRARGGEAPTPEQFEAVLAEMDPPEAFADADAAGAAASPGSGGGVGGPPPEPWRRRLCLLGLCFLVLNGAWFGLWLQRNLGGLPPDTHGAVAPSGVVDVSGAEPLSWTFPTPMVEKSACGIALKTPPAKVSPEVAGVWKWDDPLTLSFFPSRPWPDCSRFLVAFAAPLHTAAGRRVDPPESTTVETAALQLVDVRQVNVEPGEYRFEVRLELEFNAPPDLESLKEALSFSYQQDGQQTATADFEVIGGVRDSRILVTVTENANELRNLRMKFAAGLRPASGGNRGLAGDVTREVALTDLFQMGDAVASSPAFGPCELRLRFTKKADLKTLKEAVEVKPNVDFTANPEYDNTMKLTGGFEPEKIYEVTVRTTLRAEGGAALVKEAKRTVQFPPRKPSIALAAEGRYLSPRGNLSVPLSTVNIPSCKISLRQVLPQNLPFFALRDGNYWRGDENATDSLTGPESSRTVPLKGKPNEEIKQRVKLREFAGNGDLRGAWLLSVEPPDDMRGWSWERRVEAVHRLLVVSDLGVTVKTGEKQGALVWVNSLRDAQPVAGAQVVLYGKNNTELARGVTGADGVARLDADTAKPEAEPFLVTAAAGTDFTFITLKGTVTPQGETGGGDWLTADGVEAALFTDRGIYRPGETLHVKALVRNRTLEAPKPFPALFRIVKPDGKVFRDLPVTLNELGAAEGETELPAFLPTGGYRVALVMPGTFTELGDTQVRVEDFVPPQITVDMGKLPDRAETGKSFTFEVASRHLFGRAADGLKAEARVVVEPVEFRPKQWPGWRFADDSRTAGNTRRDLGGQTLDADGKAVFTVEALGELRPPSSLVAHLHATVLEPGGRPVFAYRRLPVDPYPYYLGLKLDTDGGHLRLGESRKVQVVAVAPDGSQTRPQTSRLKAVLTRVYWNNTLQRNDSGSYSWRSERVCQTEAEGAVDLAGGAGEFAFAPKQAGEYRLTVSDPFTGVSSNVAFLAAAPDQSWVSWAHDSPDRVELSLDKPRYRPGDKARLAVKAPFSGPALLTIESDRVLEHRRIVIEKNTAEVELEVRAEFAPNVYAAVSLIRPAVAEAVWSAHRAVGAVALKVEPADRRLKVDLAAPAEIRPQTALTVQLQTRDELGRGVPGEVTVMAVDEGICLLTEYKTPDLLEKFLEQRRLAVAQNDLYSLLMPPLEDEGADGAAAHPGGDGSATLMRRLNPVRANRFKPVALWAGAVPTGADGRGTAVLDVPEFTGKLRVMAVAYDRARLGAAEQPVTVKRPLVVQPALPRFAAPGDRFQASLVIFNETGAPQTVAWRVTCGGPLAAAKPEGVLQLAAGASRQVPVELTAGAVPGKALCTVLVTAGTERYEETIELPVRPAAAPVTLAFAGSLAAGAEFVQPVPADLMPETAYWELQAGGRPEVKLLRSMDHLLRYPYGCLEQTTSSAFPLLVLEDLVSTLRPQALARGEPAPFVNAAILRILAMQTADGGFSMWPGMRDSAGWAGTYATHFLVEAQKAGYAVPADRLALALEWLRRRLDQQVRINETTDNRLWQNEMEERAYACLVLARAGRPNHGWMARLHELRDRLHVGARVQTALALLYAGDPKTAAAILDAAAIPADTAPAATPPATGAPPATAAMSVPSSRTRDLALLLAARVELDPRHPQVAELVTRLDRAMKNGHWYTTQEDAMALLALGKYARALPADRTPFQAALTVDRNGTPLRADREHPLAWTSGKPGAAGRVALKNEGPGTCFYSLRVEGVPAGGAVPEGDWGGLKVRRELLDRQGNPFPGNACALGDRVTVRLTVESDAWIANGLVLCDLLPAGLEIENPSTPPEGQTATHDWVLYRDVRDDRLLLFSGWFPAGARSYTYAARAVTPGRFRLPAVTAEAMYDPAVHSARSQGEFTVREK